MSLTAMHSFLSGKVYLIMSHSGGLGVARNQPASAGPPRHNTSCLKTGHSGATTQNETCKAVGAGFISARSKDEGSFNTFWLV